TPPRARSTPAPEEAPTRRRYALCVGLQGKRCRTCCGPCPRARNGVRPVQAGSRPPLPPLCIARVISPAKFASGARTRGRYICVCGVWIRACAGRPCSSYGAPSWFAAWRPMPCPAGVVCVGDRPDGERTSGTLTSAAAATAQRVHGLHVQTSLTGGQAGMTGVRGDDDGECRRLKVPVLRVLGLHNVYSTIFLKQRRRAGRVRTESSRPGLPFIPLHLAWISGLCLVISG
ncbi:hypothetical protein C8F04DRAFT_1100454, partial [Mycena alexandri]